ncbi:MAG: hypothetical protein JST86_14700 [Bacteroidetes bacterium]|nr:hypothetical protein [Bacteroidota bacterium]
MNECKAILVCGNRIALPLLRDLLFLNRLSVLVLPANNKILVEEVRHYLQNTTLPLLYVTKTDFAEKIADAVRQYKPELGLVFSFSFRMPGTVLSLTDKGWFNIHPGPLPAYRGPDPVFRQIKNQEPFACISVHKMTADFDAGPVVMMNKIRLSVTDTYGMLSKKLGECAAQNIPALLKMADFGVQIPARPQEETKAVYYNRQAAADITINWDTMGAEEIVALINACNPWNKGAVTSLNNNIIKLLEATAAVDEDVEKKLPGTITTVSKDFFKVATVKGLLCVQLVYTDEGYMSAARLFNTGIQPGNRFGDIPV